MFFVIIFSLFVFRGGDIYCLFNFSRQYFKRVGCGIKSVLPGRANESITTEVHETEIVRVPLSLLLSLGKRREDKCWLVALEASSVVR